MREKKNTFRISKFISNEGSSRNRDFSGLDRVALKKKKRILSPLFKALLAENVSLEEHKEERTAVPEPSTDKTKSAKKDELGLGDPGDCKGKLLN